METRKLLLLLLITIIQQSSFGQDRKSYKVQTIAFYNLENLFDHEDDPITFDDDRTPDGDDHWTEELYRAKLDNMARVLAGIGRDLTGTPPVLVGLCESENRRVLEDLVSRPDLRMYDYGIIQFESPDRRGIDTALLYRKKLFTPTDYKALELVLYDDTDTSRRVYTRDQLVVSGKLDGEKIHLIINHWPSRRGGEMRSRYKRILAAQLNKRIIDSIWTEDPYARIITMGDLNDDPVNTSVKDILQTKSSKEQLGLKDLYNPMEQMYRQGLGTLAWRDSWNLFDQIIISTELARGDFSSYRFYQAGIYNKIFLTNPKGRYKGYPYRSYENGDFTGGFSDHFPVFIYLIKETSTED